MISRMHCTRVRIVWWKDPMTLERAQRALRKILMALHQIWMWTAIDYECLSAFMIMVFVALVA